MLRLAQALCTLCLALGTAWGAPIVLTGLSRIGGESRAFFSDGTPGGYFSLVPGEDRDGLRLIAVEFRERWALVADRSGTNRIVFGNSIPSAPGLTGGGQAGQMVAAAPGQRRLARVPSPDPLPATAAESAVFPALTPAENPDPSTALPEASGLPAGNGNAGSTVAAADGGSSPDQLPVQSPPSRRRATADELFKSRNGYAAWEDLLRQRHQAEMLAASPGANENP